MKPFILTLLIMLQFFMATSQNYHFERLIECQNNDFQVIGETVDEKSMENQVQSGIPSMKQQEHNANTISDTNQQNIAQVPQFKKNVRCKRWIQSYKLSKKTHLKREQQAFSGSQISFDKIALDPLQKRVLSIDIQQLGTRQITYPINKVGGVVNVLNAYDDYERNQQQSAQLMSMFFHYNLMSNILVYQQSAAQ